jgi:DNA-binding Xre family transcriptional regulator
VTSIKWRVDELLTQRGWTVVELAEAADLDRKTVRNIVAGTATRVDLATIAALSTALGVSAGALWRTEPQPHEAWDATRGAAGEAADDELAHVLVGRWREGEDPALERAIRPA